MPDKAARMRDSSPHRANIVGLAAGGSFLGWKSYAERSNRVRSPKMTSLLKPSLFFFFKIVKLQIFHGITRLVSALIQQEISPGAKDLIKEMVRKKSESRVNALRQLNESSRRRDR